MLVWRVPEPPACACSGLAQLWRQLVQGGVLSDGEFWATRQNLLGRSAPPPPQRQGFASTMIASVVPSADGKTKQVGWDRTGWLACPGCAWECNDRS